MFQIGDKVLIKRGIFVNYEGTIEREFEYNGLKRFTVAILKGKSIDTKYVATCDEQDLELSQSKNKITIKNGRLWQN